MSEKQIWFNFFRLVLVIVIVLAFNLGPSFGLSVLLPNYQAYAATSNYTWFATQGFASGLEIDDYAVGYIPFLGDYDIFSGDEAELEVEFDSDYTINNMVVRVTANTLSQNCTITSYINGATGNLSVIVPPGNTGLFSDTSNYDQVGDGDTIIWQISLPDQDDISISYVSCNYIGDHPISAGTKANVPPNEKNYGSKGYTGPQGYTVLSSAAYCDYYTYSSTNISNLRIYIISNTLDDDTIISTYVNGSTGNQSVTIGAEETGVFTDSTNYDMLGSGDRWCYELDATASGSGSLTYRSIQVSHQGDSEYLGSHSAGNNLWLTDKVYYFNLAGTIVAKSTVESKAQQYMTGNYTAANMWCYVHSNTMNGATYISSRLNGEDGNLLIEIPAGQTGVFNDTSNNDTYVVSDLVSIRTDTSNSTSGQIYVDTIGIELEPQEEGEEGDEEAASMADTFTGLLPIVRVSALVVFMAMLILGILNVSPVIYKAIKVHKL